MVARNKGASAEQRAGPAAATAPIPASTPGPSMALMALTFVLTAVVPLILFAIVDWYSISWFFTAFVPAAPGGLVLGYAALFAIGLVLWLFYSVRPVPGLHDKKIEDIRKSREKYSVLFLPALALSLAFSYVVAKDVPDMVMVAMVSTTFWLFGLFIIQSARYVDEFVLKNRPDCLVCHSPLELVLFVFAAMPGVVLGVAGYLLATLV